MEQQTDKKIGASLGLKCIGGRLKFRSALPSACDSELQNTCDQHTLLGHCCQNVQWEGPAFDIILPSNEHVGGRQQDRCIPEEGKPGQGFRSPGTLSGPAH